MRIALVALSAGIIGASAVSAADVVITACGTVVPPRTVAALAADLDCSGEPPSQPAVVLGHRATLSLAGFSLTAAADGIGVRCTDGCAVSGPGSITSAPAGPGSPRAACIRALRDVGDRPRPQRITIEGLDLHGCGAGFRGDTDKRGARLMASGVTADGNDIGLVAASIRARDTSASGNDGAGLYAPSGGVKAVNVHADDNAVDGVTAARLLLKDSTASGNGVFGVRALAGSARLLRATVTGNAFRDVVSAASPHVSASTCTTSAEWIPPNGIGAPWGVCTAD